MINIGEYWGDTMNGNNGFNGNDEFNQNPFGNSFNNGFQPQSIGNSQQSMQSHMMTQDELINRSNGVANPSADTYNQNVNYQNMQEVQSNPFQSVSQGIVNNAEFNNQTSNGFSNNTYQQQFSQPVQQSVMQQQMSSVQQPVQQNQIFQQGMMQPNNQNIYFQQGNGVKPPANKSIASWLMGVMTIIFIIVGIILYYNSTLERVLTCTSEITNQGLVYVYNNQYKFKNDILREEDIELSVNLGDYYDVLDDPYVEEIKRQFKSFEDVGYSVIVDKKKPSIIVRVSGSGESMRARNEIEMFSSATFDIVKDNAESNGYTCK